MGEEKLTKDLASIRRRLVREIKALVSPHFWESGYRKNLDPKKGIFGGTRPLLLWAPKGEDGKIVDSVELRGALVLEEIGGITEDGPITDAYGGGLVWTAYSAIPVEDLIKLHRWLTGRLALQSGEKQ